MADDTPKRAAHMAPGAFDDELDVTDDTLDVTDDTLDVADDAPDVIDDMSPVDAPVEPAPFEPTAVEPASAEDAPVAAAAPSSDDLEARLKELDSVEYAVERAFQTGKADRAQITQEAYDRAIQAADLVSVAMEADAESDELARMAIITENSRDREKIKAARQRAKAARKEAKVAHRTATSTAKEAYEAIKYSEPGRLGFVMRAVQVIFAVNIVMTLIGLVATSRDVIVYDTNEIMRWITIILQGVAFYLFMNSYKVARPFVIASSAFCLVVPALFDVAAGNFSLFRTLSDGLWYIFLILYFWRSKRVQAVLVNDFSTLKPAEADAELEINRRSWPFYRNLIMYFIVFSVLGHWMEAAMCQLIRLGLVQGEYDPTNTMLWRDWLYPYPMEGAAVVIIAVALYPLWQYLLKKWPEKPIIGYALSFVANGLTCGIIEFSMGLIVNADRQLWDYSDMPFNIMGQVCLQNVLAFAAAASIICWLVYPMLERWIARVPADTMNIVFVVIAVIGGILWSLYIIDPPQNKVASDVAANYAQKEQETVGDKIDMNDDGMDLTLTIVSMQMKIDEATDIDEETRAELQKELDEIKESDLRITEILNQAA